ncbi:MAG: formylmethanofuran dehydrogenase subunit C [Nitrososphaerales archaeon]
MVELKLKMKGQSVAPIEGEMLTPDNLAKKSFNEILNLETWRGNRLVKLSEVFTVEGESTSNPSDLHLIIEGDLRKVRHIGAHMSAGKITINGPVGTFVGFEMSGGTIVVNGDADAFLGMGMSGGMIEVNGNAGDAVGSGYWGTRCGMRGGLIVIKGNAGAELGCWMKDGTIKVGGNADAFAGVRMQGGTIFVAGNVGAKLGAAMTNGKIVVLGNVPSILPSFNIDEIRANTKVDGEKVQGPFYVFYGDITEGGNGKLFISVPKNAHLKYREAYLL